MQNGKNRNHVFKDLGATGKLNISHCHIMSMFRQIYAASVPQQKQLSEIILFILIPQYVQSSDLYIVSPTANQHLSSQREEFAKILCMYKGIIEFTIWIRTASIKEGPKLKERLPSVFLCSQWRIWGGWGEEEGLPPPPPLHLYRVA